MASGAYGSTYKKKFTGKDLTLNAIQSDENVNNSNSNIKENPTKNLRKMSNDNGCFQEVSNIESFTNSNSKNRNLSNKKDNNITQGKKGCTISTQTTLTSVDIDMYKAGADNFLKYFKVIFLVDKN